MYNNLSLIKPKPGIQLNRAHPLAQGLVACWLFNEGSGTITRDVVYGNPGTLTNFALGGSSTSGWTGSLFGGGLLFDGSNDYVNIEKGIHQYVDYNKKFSIAFWYTLSTLTAFYPNLIGSTYLRSAQFDSFELRLRDTTLQEYEVYFCNAPTTATTDGFIFRAAPPTSLQANKVYFFVYTYDGSNSYIGANLYHDAQILSKNSVSDYGAITQSIYQAGRLADQPFLIGSRYYGNIASADLPFPGMIHSVRVYNRVLSKSEIQTLYVNPHIDFRSDNLFMTNPTLYGLGAWKGDLINAGASGTLTADSVDNNVEAAMALSFKKA